MLVKGCEVLCFVAELIGVVISEFDGIDFVDENFIMFVDFGSAISVSVELPFRLISSFDLAKTKSG